MPRCPPTYPVSAASAPLARLGGRRGAARMLSGRDGSYLYVHSGFLQLRGGRVPRGILCAPSGRGAPLPQPPKRTVKCTGHFFRMLLPCQFGVRVRHLNLFRNYRPHLSTVWCCSNRSAVGVRGRSVWTPVLWFPAVCQQVLSCPVWHPHLAIWSQCSSHFRN